MEFWGVEVKAGQSLKVKPGNGKILHLSQASLGESKKGKGDDSVPLTLKFGHQKLVLGTLSPEKFPQLSFDLVVEKEFELAHNWKNGSVYFCGYKTVIPDDDDFSDYSDSDEEMPLEAMENGKPEKTLVTAKGNLSKPEVSAKPKTKPVEQSKDSKPIDDEDDDEEDDDDSDDDDSGDGESDDEDMTNAQSDDSDDDKEELPKKAEAGKKRPTESAIKTPVPAKKAKVATPQKTDGKKGGHTATPFPKQAGKTPAGAPKSKTQSPKSGVAVACNSCSKTFKTEASLQSHSAAKHSSGK